jgi:hypothetical protein
MPLKLMMPILPQAIFQSLLHSVPNSIPNNQFHSIQGCTQLRLRLRVTRIFAGFLLSLNCGCGCAAIDVLRAAIDYSRTRIGIDSFEKNYSMGWNFHPIKGT